MAQQKGANSKLLMGFETNFSTAATAGFKVPFNSSGLAGSQALNTPATILSGRNPVQPFKGNRNVEGNITVPVDSIGLWYWLRGLFNSPTTTSAQPNVGPYTHEFKISDSQPSITFEHQFEDIATAAFGRFTGCKLGGMTLKAGGDKELTAEFSVLGSVDSIETTAFDAAPTAVQLARLNNFQASVMEGGASLGNAREFSLKVDMGLDGDQYVMGGGGVRGSIPEGVVSVSGTLTTLFEDITLLEKAINGAESSLLFKLDGGADNVFELDFQEIEFERHIPKIDGPQGILAELNFNAFYGDGVGGSALIARLINNEAHV